MFGVKLMPKVIPEGKGRQIRTFGELITTSQALELCRHFTLDNLEAGIEAKLVNEAQRSQTCACLSLQKSLQQ
jgi:hypothetical protein